MARADDDAPPSGAAQTRERILRASAECFAKDGYRRTRMVSVARMAEVSRAALYTHFPSKADLLRALSEYISREWRTWTLESVSTATTAREGIECWLREGLGDAWRLTTVRVLTAEDAQGDLFPEPVGNRDTLRETRNVLALVLKRGIDAGEFRQDLDVESTAHGLQAILLGLLRNNAADRPLLSLEREREVEALVSLFLRGLAA